MGVDYSQFYAGTSTVKSYGNGAYKKDTLVKYEFRTTDENGNNVMDKNGDGQVDREETLQAMKEISSQYGDNVIVEFSGDGMAALVENRKGQVTLTDEQLAAKAERDAAFADEIKQNEHREAAPEDTENSSKSAALKFTENKPKLSDKAQKLLDELSAKYGNINFLVGDSDNVKELMKNSGKAYSVLLTAKELEKMASDDAYKEEVLGKTNRLIDFSNRINEKYGFTTMGGALTNGVEAGYGIAFNSVGKESLFAELFHRAKEKKALLLASSENELLGRIERFDWSEIEEEIKRKIVFKE